jgi:hypothetical protein
LAASLRVVQERHASLRHSIKFQTGMKIGDAPNVNPANAAFRFAPWPDTERSSW